MEMMQQLFMAAFATFVFSILVEKLACVTINGDERKSKRTIVHNTKSKSKKKNNKKVPFALHDQIAIVVNNKLVKLDTVDLPKKKQNYGPTGYNLKEVYLGANWIGEELLMSKEFGLSVELQELLFDGIQTQRHLPSDEAQTWLEIDDDCDYQTVECKDYNIAFDFVPRKYVD